MKRVARAWDYYEKTASRIEALEGIAATHNDYALRALITEIKAYIAAHARAQGDPNYVIPEGLWAVIQDSAQNINDLVLAALGISEGLHIILRRGDRPNQHAVTRLDALLQGAARTEVELQHTNVLDFRPDTGVSWKVRAVPIQSALKISQRTSAGQPITKFVWQIYSPDSPFMFEVYDVTDETLQAITVQTLTVQDVSEFFQKQHIDFVVFLIRVDQPEHFQAKVAEGGPSSQGAEDEHWSYQPHHFPALFHQSLRRELSVAYADAQSTQARVDWIVQGAGAAFSVEPAQGSGQDPVLTQARQLFQDAELAVYDAQGRLLDLPDSPEVSIVLVRSAIQTITRVLNAELKRTSDQLIQEDDVIRVLVAHEQLEAAARNVDFVSMVDALDRQLPQAWPLYADGSRAPPQNLQQILTTFAATYAYHDPANGITPDQYDPQTPTGRANLLREVMIHMITEARELRNPLRIRYERGADGDTIVREILPPEMANWLIVFASHQGLIHRGQVPWIFAPYEELQVMYAWSQRDDLKPNIATHFDALGASSDVLLWGGQNQPIPSNAPIVVAYPDPFVVRAYFPGTDSNGEYYLDFIGIHRGRNYWQVMVPPGAIRLAEYSWPKTIAFKLEGTYGLKYAEGSVAIEQGKPWMDWIEANLFPDSSALDNPLFLLGFVASLFRWDWDIGGISKDPVFRSLPNGLNPGSEALVEIIAVLRSRWRSLGLDNQYGDLDYWLTFSALGSIMSGQRLMRNGEWIRDHAMRRGALYAVARLVVHLRQFPRHILEDLSDGTHSRGFVDVENLVRLLPLLVQNLLDQRSEMTPDEVSLHLWAIASALDPASYLEPTSQALYGRSLDYRSRMLRQLEQLGRNEEILALLKEIGETDWHALGRVHPALAVTKDAPKSTFDWVVWLPVNDANIFIHKILSSLEKGRADPIWIKTWLEEASEFGYPATEQGRIAQYESALAADIARLRSNAAEPLLSKQLKARILEEAGRSDGFSAEALVDSIMQIPGFAEKFQPVEGQREWHQLRPHIITVLQRFTDHFAESDVFTAAASAAEIENPVLFFRIVFTLHDIEKFVGVERIQDVAAWKDNAYTRSADTAATVMQELGFSEREIMIARALIGADPLGEALRQVKGTPMMIPEAAVKTASAIIIQRASLARLASDRFFDLLMIFYQCDAGSYAGRFKAIEWLFELPDGPVTSERPTIFSAEATHVIEQLRLTVEDRVIAQGIIDYAVKRMGTHDSGGIAIDEYYWMMTRRAGDHALAYLRQRAAARQMTLEEYATGLMTGQPEANQELTDIRMIYDLSANSSHRQAGNNSNFFYSASMFSYSVSLGVPLMDLIEETIKKRMDSGLRRLHIGSSGIALGQELWTTRMVVDLILHKIAAELFQNPDEQQRWIAEWDIQITGYDIDPFNLYWSEQGIYHPDVLGTHRATFVAKLKAAGRTMEAELLEQWLTRYFQHLDSAVTPTDQGVKPAYISPSLYLNIDKEAYSIQEQFRRGVGVEWFDMTDETQWQRLPNDFDLFFVHNAGEDRLYQPDESVRRRIARRVRDDSNRFTGLSQMVSQHLASDGLLIVGRGNSEPLGETYTLAPEFELIAYSREFGETGNWDKQRPLWAIYRRNSSGDLTGASGGVNNLLERALGAVVPHPTQRQKAVFNRMSLIWLAAVEIPFLVLAGRHLPSDWFAIGLVGFVAVHLTLELIQLLRTYRARGEPLPSREVRALLGRSLVQLFVLYVFYALPAFATPALLVNPIWWFSVAALHASYDYGLLYPKSAFTKYVHSIGKHTVKYGLMVGGLSILTGAALFLAPLYMGYAPYFPRELLALGLGIAGVVILVPVMMIGGVLLIVRAARGLRNWILQGNSNPGRRAVLTIGAFVLAGAVLNRLREEGDAAVRTMRPLSVSPLVLHTEGGNSSPFGRLSPEEQQRRLKSILEEMRVLHKISTENAAEASLALDALMTFSFPDLVRAAEIEGRSGNVPLLLDPEVINGILGFVESPSMLAISYPVRIKLQTAKQELLDLYIIVLSMRYGREWLEAGIPVQSNDPALELIRQYALRLASYTDLYDFQDVRTLVPNVSNGTDAFNQPIRKTAELLLGSGSSAPWVLYPTHLPLLWKLEIPDQWVTTGHAAVIATHVRNEDVHPIPFMALPFVREIRSQVSPDLAKHFQEQAAAHGLDPALLLTASFRTAFDQKVYGYKKGVDILARREVITPELSHVLQAEPLGTAIDRSSAGEILYDPLVNDLLAALMMAQPSMGLDQIRPVQLYRYGLADRQTDDEVTLALKLLDPVFNIKMQAALWPKIGQQVREWQHLAKQGSPQPDFSEWAKGTEGEVQLSPNRYGDYWELLRVLPDLDQITAFLYHPVYTQFPFGSSRHLPITVTTIARAGLFDQVPAEITDVEFDYQLDELAQLLNGQDLYLKRAAIRTLQKLSADPTHPLSTKAAELLGTTSGMSRRKFLTTLGGLRPSAGRDGLSSVVADERLSERGWVHWGRLLAGVAGLLLGTTIVTGESSGPASLAVLSYISAHSFQIIAALWLVAMIALPVLALLLVPSKRSRRSALAGLGISLAAIACNIFGIPTPSSNGASEEAEPTLAPLSREAISEELSVSADNREEFELIGLYEGWELLDQFGDKQAVIKVAVVEYENEESPGNLSVHGQKVVSVANLIAGNRLEIVPYIIPKTQGENEEANLVEQLLKDGIQVVSSSIDWYSAAHYAALLKAGVLIVQAAGNDPIPSRIAHSEVLTVGAVDRHGRVYLGTVSGTDFTTGSPTVDLYAPGGLFLPDGEAFYGTSVAAPIVAVIAGMVIKVRPDISREELHALLIKSTTSLKEGSPKIINLPAAMQEARQSNLQHAPMAMPAWNSSDTVLGNSGDTIPTPAAPEAEHLGSHEQLAQVPFVPMDSGGVWTELPLAPETNEPTGGHSPDGWEVVRTLGDDVFVVRPDRQRPWIELGRPTGPMTSLAINHGGRHVAMGYADGRVEIWDVVRRERLATLKGHVRVDKLWFEENGQALSTLGTWADGTFRATHWRPLSSGLANVLSAEQLALLMEAVGEAPLRIRPEHFPDLTQWLDDPATLRTLPALLTRPQESHREDAIEHFWLALSESRSLPWAMDAVGLARLYRLQHKLEALGISVTDVNHHHTASNVGISGIVPTEFYSVVRALILNRRKLSWDQAEAFWKEAEAILEVLRRQEDPNAHALPHVGDWAALLFREILDDTVFSDYGEELAGWAAAAQAHPTSRTHDIIKRAIFSALGPNGMHLRFYFSSTDIDGDWKIIQILFPWALRFLQEDWKMLLASEEKIGNDAVIAMLTDEVQREAKALFTSMTFAPWSIKEYQQLLQELDTVIDTAEVSKQVLGDIARRWELLPLIMPLEMEYTAFELGEACIRYLVARREEEKRSSPNIPSQTPSFYGVFTANSEMEQQYLKETHQPDKIHHPDILPHIYQHLRGWVLDDKPADGQGSEKDPEPGEIMEGGPEPSLVPPPTPSRQTLEAA